LKRRIGDGNGEQAAATVRPREERFVVSTWRFGGRDSSMAVPGLIAFWIVPPSAYGPLAFGVTAWSFDDALWIIRALDYGRYLPDDVGALRVTEGVTVADLDQSHVVANMGPIVVRGMWYPFVAVGVPAWADAGPGGVADRPRE
jgi:hypothetical protein